MSRSLEPASFQVTPSEFERDCALGKSRKVTNSQCTEGSANHGGAFDRVQNSAVHLVDITAVVEAYTGGEYADYCDEPCE